MQLLYLRKWLPISLLLLLLIIGLGVISPAPARAHAEYDHSDPPAGAVIPQPSAEVHIWFTQELFRREGANTLAVFGPTGTQVDKGDARLDDDDRTHMLVSLAEGLPDGLYTVRWHNLSLEDGDEDSGEFSFTVDSAAAPAPTETPPAPTVHNSETVPTAPEPAAPLGSSLPCLNGLILGMLALGIIVISPKGQSGTAQ